MARIAVDDGISITACTPHIYPRVYENRADDIRRRVEVLAGDLSDAGSTLRITDGADIQLVPDLLEGLRGGRLPTLGGSRYFLFEPPHFSVPDQFLSSLFDVLAAGFVPIITHPERLTWTDETHYGWFGEAALEGAWIQLTAGAVTGRFGRRPRYWAERFLGDGLVHILATDAHDPRHRPPILSEGLRVAERALGSEEARRLVIDRPGAVLADQDPDEVTPPPALADDTDRPMDDHPVRPLRRDRPFLERLKGLFRAND
jgi:protein-tyrosine phosphatase